MSARFIAELFFAFLGWAVCLAFVGAAVYIHYIMASPKDVTPLVMGGIFTGIGSCVLTYHVVTGEWPG